MDRVRPVVAVAVVALLVGALALLYVRQTDDGGAWEWVAIRDVVLDGDRSDVVVLADTYRSGSCTEHRVVVDRNGTEWTVRLQARRVEEFCTMEGCGWEGSTIAEVRRLGGLTSGGQCPPVFTLELDEPAPPGVAVVPGR